MNKNQPDPLKSPKLKVKRAKTLIDELKRVIDRFFDTTERAMVRMQDANTPGNEVIAMRIAEPVPDEVALIIGDAAHNLRTALDHLACCLAVANGRSMNGVSFPFGPNPEEFEARASEKIKKISSDARDMIFRLKPYKGGDDLLHALNEIDLGDKHRTIVVTIVRHNKLGGTFSTDGPIQMTTDISGSLEKGIPLFSIPKGTKFEHDLNVTVAVAFNEIEAIEGQPVTDILQQHVDLIEGIILLFENRFFSD